MASVELVFAVGVGVGDVDARGGEVQEPAEVGRENEMPGRAEDVGAKDRAVVAEPIERQVARAPRSLGNAPLCASIILGLDGNQ